MCLNIFFCLSTFAGQACAFCHPLMRILFLPLCTHPNLFTFIMQWWKPCYSKKPWMAAGSSVQGVSLHSHHAPPCLFGIVSPLIYAPVTSWNGPCQCCSNGILSTLVNKTHLRPHLQNPFQIHRCCAVWMLFCVTLPWVVCVCPLSCPNLLGPSDCQEHICSVEYIEPWGWCHLSKIFL